MTDFKQGDRVRVSYEADYFASTEGMIQVTVEGMNFYAPGGATIEVIKPEVKEPQAFGALVEVGDLRATRSDDSSDAWYGNDEDWYSWAELQAKGEIKILFDPDAPSVTAPVAEAHPDLRDEDGDIWRWQETGHSGAGYYCVPASWTDGDEPVYRISRDAVVSAYGPVTEVA